MEQKAQDKVTEPKSEIKGRGTVDTDKGIGQEALDMVVKIKEKVPELSPIFDKVVATFSKPYSGPRPACLDALIAGSQALHAGCPSRLLAEGYTELMKDLALMSREDVELLTFAFMTQYNTEVNTNKRNALPLELRELIESAAKKGTLNIVTDAETAAALRGDGVDLSGSPGATKEDLN